MPSSGKATPNIATPRLQLVAITPESLTSEQNSDGKLSEILHCRVTPEWPHADWEPHVLQLLQQRFAEDPTDIGWHRYILLSPTSNQPATLIGSVGAVAGPTIPAPLRSATPSSPSSASTATPSKQRKP
ncbi:hypothetical protein RBB75_01905 [Tunturibacter empetritectus]|uniref:Uncharacterized protein n=1 Tax=Tunturiibacter empetritectus TaxID=3069691 RepID=A0AAU7ZER4_9BACT